MRTMLTKADREEISRGLAEDLLFVEIAGRIGRDASVISREVARHGGRGDYRAVDADQVACAVRARPKLLAVERSPRLHAVVGRQLRGGWSPASIAGRLATDYPDDQACRVSHEAIYQWVYAQPVSTLARELIGLRTGRTARRGGRRPPSAPRIRSGRAGQGEPRWTPLRGGVPVGPGSLRTALLPRSRAAKHLPRPRRCAPRRCSAGGRGAGGGARGGGARPGKIFFFPPGPGEPPQS